MVKKVGQYQLGRTLGEGTFGKVKYAEHVVTNGAVAIKVLEKEKIQKQNMGEQIRKEISIMKKILSKCPSKLAFISDKVSFYQEADAKMPS